MSLIDYRCAVRLLCDTGTEMLSSVSATRDEISRIECRLGITLPESYKSMLMDFGTMAFDGVEIFGWTKAGLASGGAPCAMFMTEFDRSRGLISDRMVTIMVSGYGPSMVLDCSELLHGEAPVYEISGGGIRCGRDRLSDSFGAFLLEETMRTLGASRSEG